MGTAHVVRLSDDRRAGLEQRFVGPLTRRQRNRVHVLLRPDGGETDADIGHDPGVTMDEVKTWVAGRNAARATINGTFRVADACKKPAHLYPQNPYR